MELIDRNGEFIDREDWLRYAVQLMKLQDQKVAAQKYGQEIREFEKHTKRLTEVFTSFVSNVMFHEEESAEKLTKNKQQIQELQAKILSTNEKIQQQEKDMVKLAEMHQQELLEAKQLHIDKKKHLEDRIEELQKELAKSNAFTEQQTRNITDYQNRLDEKDKELNRYKGLQVENEELKESIFQQREQYSETFNVLNASLAEKEKTINSLTYELEKAGIEKEKAILHIKQEAQEQLAKAHEEYNVRVRELLK